MRKQRIVLLSGGIGNQLFQFTFAHLLAKHWGFKIVLYAPTLKNAARKFELERLCANCTHISEVRTRKSLSLDFVFKFRDFVKSNIDVRAGALFDRHLFIETNAYAISQFKNTPWIYSGYFQNWQYVNDAMPEICSELLQHIAGVTGMVSQDLEGAVYGVLHYRRGDLLNYRETMGVLDDSYFLDALNCAFADLNQQIRLIVITDDKENAAKAMVDYTDEVYGPSEVQEWEALKIMSNATFVITSNSTFSWWGAFFASQLGGKVYIPSPWFRNWSPDPKEAFHFPVFNLIPSRFSQEP